jgi:hypothetical protein
MGAPCDRPATPPPAYERRRLRWPAYEHAHVVFDVCLRVLHDLHDAENAFQVTFLALAHHAGRIAKV